MTTSARLLPIGLAEEPATILTVLSELCVEPLAQWLACPLSQLGVERAVATAHKVEFRNGHLVENLRHCGPRDREHTRSIEQNRTAEPLGVVRQQMSRHDAHARA
eukprot:CAMPEP_0171073932 /NCGR_PEP_ID=MMETSP0766_2-20121228/11817_1 /TAXON_ID=439317 /ORGANISM="Gambierdiscus australes, Strain CAWD 149" /LENGTH=104 /DNA_ID=CAMNT_0011530667 /DNA_START=475 /DNA_END=789 /DNA_ORIENTATION=-